MARPHDVTIANVTADNTADDTNDHADTDDKVSDEETVDDDSIHPPDSKECDQKVGGGSDPVAFGGTQ